MTSLLILGGTGIVGSATSKIARESGFDVTVTGVDEKPDLVDGVKFVHANEYNNLTSKSWDVVFDIYAFSKKQSQESYQRFKDTCNHYFVLSTTLVYDRSGLSFQRISSNHEKAKKGSQGGYVDKKLEVEDFWEKKEDINWTILRPYHIIGSGSYLGCLPPHNRDPMMREQMKQGEIELCDGGRIPINIVNPMDIGEVVVRSADNSLTYRKSYNVVNPQEIIARDYYKKIAKILGIELKIKNIPGENVWPMGEWNLTTLPHLYDTNSLERDVGFLPSIGLEESLREAIDNHPRREGRSETQVYQRMHTLPLFKSHKYFE